MIRKTDGLAKELRSLLETLNRQFARLYGEERYRGLILYGSYARGDAEEGSDVDLLLLLEGEVDPVRELRRVHPLKWPLALEAGYTVSLVPLSAGDYSKTSEPFLYNARREGVPFS